ncbi:peptidoglycan-binding protein LysM [Enterobacter asburiae]|uniref:peptidoglycan-binding protein LysM n=1 Tax=Enterobacter asburiae TaxID=61645 RepID=UPI0021D1D576|nr:peptidoglycan-binding protein LysM [Enterobacter asburiae]MCU6239930.1 peptidoglycan-binding protein LysM [Enterobacter asburiae]
MGLFSFVKDAGEKVWDAVSGSSKNNHADKLKAHINSLNIPGAEKVDFTVEEDGIATVAGALGTLENKEKILVAVGNMCGIGQVNDSITVMKHGPESRFFVVKSGDTLSSISKEIYGSAGDYMMIFEANKPMLKHPDRIYPGQTLIIPEK